jgi:hypothetical protein
MGTFTRSKKYHASVPFRNLKTGLNLKKKIYLYIYIYILPVESFEKYRLNPILIKRGNSS